MPTASQTSDQYSSMDLSTFSISTTTGKPVTSLGTTETQASTMFGRNSTDITLPLSLSTSTAHQVSTFVSTLNNTTFQPHQSTIGNSSVFNISDEDKSEYLAYLQEQTTKGMIPAMGYLIILAAVGLFGNSLVLFVYSRKFKQTSTRVFILAIACFDIITNVVAIPGEIYDMFHIWDFDQPMVCKTRLFFNAFTTMVAAMVLVAVAVVRYRKICKPFKKQVTVKLARIISVILALLSLLFSIPYAIINGRQTKETPRGKFGSECTIDDSYVGTIWPLMNGAFFIFLFIICSIPLVVMYIMIGITAWRHSKIYGVATHSKAKAEAHNSDSGHTNETGTKSTDDAPLKFPKSPKTRSFVKRKGESVSELPSESSHKKNDDGSSCIGNDRQENSILTPNSKTQNNRDDIDAVTNVEDKNKEGKNVSNNNNFSVRMIRSPTGERVNVNMCMVRELTVKLKAVKKEVENRTNDNDDSGNDSENADLEHDKSSQKLSKFKEGENIHEENESVNKFEMNTPKNGSKHLSKVKKQRNKSADNNLYVDLRKALSSCPAKRFSKSVDDLSRLVERRPTIVKNLARLKSAEHEDLDLRPETKDPVENPEPAKDETTEAPNDEPVSEFVKVMQWVELTYCQEEDKKDNENAKIEPNCEETDSASLSKKGSFAMGRKISRDNSFLQRHRKLKDALTDTLTRARKSRRERENAEAEAKDNYGIGALENINSESENTCSNEDNDLALQGTDIKNNSNERHQEDKAYKRKASSNVIENIPNGEPGNKIQLIGHRARRQGIGRTTAMLILISAVYILGFLPFLGLMFAKSASPGTFQSMDMAPSAHMASFALYNLFLRSYFLNSAANPIIYSLCDINFRRECFGLLKCS